MSSLKRPTHPRYYGEGYPDWPAELKQEGESWTSIAGLSSESIRQSLRNAVAVAEDGRGGDVRILGETTTTEAATRKLVTKLARKYRQLTFATRRGRRIRALSADQEAWPRLHRGGALADPEETWRSGEDEPTRCGRPSQAIARRGTHRGLGTDERHGGDARSLARP